MSAASHCEHLRPQSLDTTGLWRKNIELTLKPELHADQT